MPKFHHHHLPFPTPIKFALPPAEIPTEKCIWSAPHPHALVIVTGPGPSQRIDIDIIDSTPQRNVYPSSTARLACTLKILWPQVDRLFSCCVDVGRLTGYGLNVKCTGRDRDCTEHDEHDRPCHWCRLQVRPSTLHSLYSPRSPTSASSSAIANQGSLWNRAGDA